MTENPDAHWLRCWSESEMARGNVSNAQRFLEIADRIDLPAEPVAWMYRYVGEDPYPKGMAERGYVVARSVSELGGVELQSNWQRLYPLYRASPTAEDSEYKRGYDDGHADATHGLYPEPPERHWIPVSERLPKPHTHVLCRNRDGSQFEGCVCYGMHKPFFTYPRGDGSPSNTAPAWIDVTHWMDLPAGPSK